MNDYFSYEKLEYLRNITITLTPLINLKLLVLKHKGYTQEKLDLEEFKTRFNSYANRHEKLWKNFDWGNKESENLYEFANGFLIQEINNTKSNKTGKSK